MLIKCKACGAHVPEEVAVDLPASAERYCSLRCAVEAEPVAVAGVLPELPRRILVAVDGSGPSLRAVQLAVALARPAGATVTLLHAIEPDWIRRRPGTPGAAEVAAIERALRSEAERQLERCRRLCEAAGVEVAVRIDVEAPVRAVAAAALDADLVVMGSRGLDATSGSAIGSLSQRVLAETRKPLLVVH